MTLGELIECGLIKDDDTIAVHLHLNLIGGLNQVRRGQWYQDQILDVMDREIDTLRFYNGYWDVDLQTKEED